MFKLLRFFCIFVTLITFLFFSFYFNANASNLDQVYLFFGRNQVNTQTDMILMFSPSASYSTGGVLTITFSEDIGEWCVNNASMVVTGVDSSALDNPPWEIDAALPSDTSLSATCIPGDVGLGIYDSIVVENIGALTAGLGYGIKFDESINFKTSSFSGDKNVAIEIADGIVTAGTFVSVSLMAFDSISFSAFVSDIDAISCTISTPNVSLGALPRGGSYVTTIHNLSTESSLANGFYWAVYGQGDGTNAGLWKSTLPTSLIPSTGSTTINLSLNQGFGLNASSSSGIVPSDFSGATVGVFGAINSGSANSRLIFYENNPSLTNITITLGARAAIATEVGPHTEILTYICGGLY